jgi:hypothetical protein
VRNLQTIAKVLGFACVLTLASAHAAEEKTDSGPVRLIRNIQTGATNQVATVAFGAGVRNCAPRIDQVTNFLMQGVTGASALLFVPERDPDNNMVSMAMEWKTDTLSRGYVSATFAPNMGIGCGAEYETVQYWNEACSMVAGKTFKGAVASGAIGSDISILTIGPSARVFMIKTTPASCVTIKKEVLR